VSAALLSRHCAPSRLHRTPLGWSLPRRGVFALCQLCQRRSCVEQPEDNRTGSLVTVRGAGWGPSATHRAGHPLSPHQCAVMAAPRTSSLTGVAFVVSALFRHRFCRQSPDHPTPGTQTPRRLAGKSFGTSAIKMSRLARSASSRGRCNRAAVTVNRQRLVLGGLIQPVGVALAMQIRTPASWRRNLHLMLDTVP